MNAGRIWQCLFTLAIASAIGVIASPSQAQLAAGCSCPAGFNPATSTTCVNNVLVVVPAICPGRNAGHVAASQQQLSFWGVQMMLQQRRDQLQGTLGGRGNSSIISGYASSDFDSDTHALGYDSQSKKTNPLASSAHAAASAPANPAWGGWVQGMGDWERDNALSATDVGHFTSTYAAQGGVDRTWRGLAASDDALVVGIVSSWTGSHVSYDNTPTTMRLDGPGVGVYGEYVRGGFSADLTTKFDFLQMKLDFAGVAANTSIDITNAGLSGNLQYKVTWADNNFVEPTAGFSFTRTIFGSGAAALNLEDSNTLRLQAGARLGATWHVNGVSVDASLKGLVYGDAIVTGTSITAGALGAASAPTDEGLVRGELDPELCFNLPDGYSVTLSGQFRFGRAMEGGSAGLNLRKQW